MRVCNACHKSPCVLSTLLLSNNIETDYKISDAWAYVGKKVAAMIAPYDIRDLVLPVRLYYPQGA